MFFIVLFNTNSKEKCCVDSTNACMRTSRGYLMRLKILPAESLHTPPEIHSRKKKKKNGLLKSSERIPLENEGVSIQPELRIPRADLRAPLTNNRRMQSEKQPICLNQVFGLFLG